MLIGKRRAQDVSDGQSHTIHHVTISGIDWYLQKENHAEGEAASTDVENPVRFYAYKNHKRNYNSEICSGLRGKGGYAGRADEVGQYLDVFCKYAHETSSFFMDL